MGQPSLGPLDAPRICAAAGGRRGGAKWGHQCCRPGAAPSLPYPSESLRGGPAV